MKKIYAVLLIILSVSFGAFAQSNPVVQDIQAQTGYGNRINVFWTLPQNTKPAITKLVLYRNTMPITSYSQVKKLFPIAELTPAATGFTDYVFDFNDYFYCVISYTDKPYDMVLISMNSTVNGVHLSPVALSSEKNKAEVPEKLYLDGEKRETPLPFIDYVEGMNKDQIISKSTVDATSQFQSKAYGEKKEISPYFFEEDLISPDGGDDFLLFEILKTTFVQEKYEEAIVELKKLTSRNITESVQNRAYFYMAEAQFFTEEYDDCVRTFLLITKAYPSETKKWINLALDNLAIPR